MGRSRAVLPVGIRRYVCPLATDWANRRPGQGVILGDVREAKYRVDANGRSTSRFDGRLLYCPTECAKSHDRTLGRRRALMG